MGDWEERRARLESCLEFPNAWIESEEVLADIRAALERVEHLELEGKLREVDRLGETARANAAEAKLAQAQDKLAKVVEAIHILQEHDPPLNHEIRAFLDGVLAAAKQTGGR